MVAPPVVAEEPRYQRRPIRDYRMSRPRFEQRRAQRRARMVAERPPRSGAQRLAEMKTGGMSLRQIGAELTGKGIRTPRGGEWTAAAVRSVLLRVEANAC
jgi:hypothetical protein